MLASAAETAKTRSLWRVTSTPQARAAGSLERMASSARPKSRARDAEAKDQCHDRDRGDQKIVGAVGREYETADRERADAGEPRRPAGDVRPFAREGERDHQQAEACHREIEPAQHEDQAAEHERHAGGEHDADQHRGVGGPVEFHGEIAGRVGADHHEGALPERELAAVAGEQHETHHHDRHDAGEDRRW